jgi:hypothetical protein
LLSRAAKQIAAGFLSSAVCSIVSCLSTSDSDAGPSYVIVAPSRRLVGGALLDGLPELVLGALRYDRDVRVLRGRGGARAAGAHHEGECHTAGDEAGELPGLHVLLRAK